MALHFSHKVVATCRIYYYLSFQSRHGTIINNLPTI